MTDLAAEGRWNCGICGGFIRRGRTGTCKRCGTSWDNGPRHCPDDGWCHHGCTIGCWRVANCGPLGAEEWDPATVAAYSRNDGRL